MENALDRAPDKILRRLETERNIWLASMRPDGRPHLVPIWFAWNGGKLYICIEPGSVKARNMAKSPLVSLALEDGSDVVICEGRAAVVSQPWPDAVEGLFRDKYGWEIGREQQYTQLVAIIPRKWLTWGDGG